MKSLFSVLPFLAAILGASLFFLLVNPLGLSFTGFVKLDWQMLDNCRNVTSQAHAFKLLSRTVTWGPEEPKKDSICLSHPILPRGKIVELEYAGHSTVAHPKDTYIEILGPDYALIHRFFLPSSTGSGVWHLHSHHLPSPPPSKIYLRIFDRGDTPGWVALRNKLNFYGAESPFSSYLRRAKQLISPEVLMYAAALFFSLSLLFMLRRFSSYSFLDTKFYWLLFYLILALGCHLRIGAFFHADEWSVLERFSLFKEAGFLAAHNEHVIPFFIAAYYVQHLLFGNYYILYQIVSCITLALCALTLCSLGLKLIKGSGLRAECAYLSAFVFTVSGLQSESVHWAICQSTLFSLRFVLLSIMFGWDFLRDGRYRLLVLSLFFAAAAPLFFGGAFVLPILFGSLLMFKWFREPSRAWRRRGLVLLLSLAAALVIPFLFYLAFRDGSGHSVSQVKIAAADELLGYVFIGAFFGAFLRGLGLSLTSFTVEEFAAHVDGALTTKLPAPLLAILAGAAAAALVFSFCLYPRSDRRHAVSLFLLGLAFIFAPLILSAPGRASLGVGQSLALRYHSFTLMGLGIALLPLLSRLTCPLLACGFRNRNASESFGAFILLWAYSSSALLMCSSFTYYQNNGALLRKFNEQVAYWNLQLKRSPHDQNIPYEGLGTDYEGLYPILYGGHPDSPSGMLSLIHPDTLAELSARE